jgi:hypothetical protein
MPRYRLRTLLIALAIGPMVLARGWAVSVKLFLPKPQSAYEFVVVSGGAVVEPPSNPR